MAKTVAVMGYGVPTKQQALLFDEVILIETPQYSTSLDNLRHYLVENAVCRFERVSAINEGACNAMEVLRETVSEFFDENLALTHLGAVSLIAQLVNQAVR